MTDVNQPRSARRSLLPAGILATALFALLAWAPFASAAPDPVAGGSTTITLNKGFTKYLKTFGITTSKISPTKLKGKKATFTITGGTIDPLTGQGSVTLSGGLKFKAGKKGAPVRGLVLDTTKKKLTGKIGGKKVKFATVAGITTARVGFNSTVTIKKVKLTGSAASALNRKLGYAKGKPKPFLRNKLIAKASGETAPSTLGVIPAGSATLALSAAALQKLAVIGPEVEVAPGVKVHPFAVKLEPVAPTTVVAPGPPPTVAFPLGPEGTMAPGATAGVVKTLGGLKLTQSLEAAPPPGTKGETTLTMGNIWVDLAAKTASVEVTILNPKTPEANLGNLGRASIADISLVGATVTSDPATHAVSVTNATATLQAVTAATLNQVFVEPVEGKGKGTFAAGDPLGIVSFSVTTE